MHVILPAAAGTAGYATGIAFHVSRPVRPAGEAGASSFQEALTAVRTDLAALAAGNGPGAEVFAAHLEMADDPLLTEQVELALSEGVEAPEAVDRAADAICALFEGIDDPYLRARTDDVRDVCRRIRDRLTGADAADPFAEMPDGAVVVAEELSPSDTARMDLSRVRAFVTARGSETSHVCIIARSKGIPALLGVEIADIPVEAQLLVDAGGRRVVIDPTDEDLAAAAHPAEEDHTAVEEAVARHLAALQAGAWSQLLPPEGPHTVAVYGNAGGLEDVRAAMAAGADGIGLFRSEFLYLSSDALPSEEEQFAAYRDAALLCDGKLLTIRTLDIGGDKALPYLDLPREDNPFLGFRALRVCLARPEALFKPQLRAILRASAFGRVRLLLPMVTSVAELRAVRALLTECRAELDAAGQPYAADLPVGAMIETPAAALIAGELAREADFFSIGTNDLTQYILAADRGNPAVATLYDGFHPAVLRAIALTLAGARAAGIPVGVCGELAADPVAARILQALGVDSISLSAPEQIPARRALLQA